MSSMNELVFASQLLLVLFAIFIAIRLGKNALAALIGALVLLANLFVIKEINLFGLGVTASDAFAVGCFFALNLGQEFFGKKFATGCVKISFFILFFFFFAALAVLFFEPAAGDVAHAAFCQIFKRSPRIVISGLLIFFLTQRLDLMLFSHLRKRLSLYRSQLLSLFVSQLFDTALFTFAALYGQVKSPGDIILFSYLVKAISIFFAASLARLAKKYLTAGQYA